MPPTGFAWSVRSGPGKIAWSATRFDEANCWGHSLTSESGEGKKSARSRERESAGRERRMAEIATDKPFQFSLWSLFVATSAIAVAFGLLKWLGPENLVLVVQFVAVVAVLVMGQGTAWPWVVGPGLFAAVVVFTLSHFHVLAVPYWASLAAWCGGGLAADAESKRRSRFLRAAWQLALIWLAIVLVFGPKDVFLHLMID